MRTQRRICRRGQDTTEYALLIALLALAVTAGILIFGGSVAAAYGDTSGCVPVPGKGPPAGVPGKGPPACKGGRGTGS